MHLSTRILYYLVKLCYYIFIDLEFDLRPYAIKSKLSSSVAKFYMSASTAGKFDRELGRGLAATSITFGSIL